MQQNYFSIFYVFDNHHFASRIQDFLEVFFMFFQYIMRYLVVNKKKNPSFV